MSEEMCSSNIGHNIKQLRLMRKLTQSDMSDQLNISVTALSHYENGLRVPNIDLLVAIEKLFDVDIHDLIEDDYKKDLND